MIKQLLAFVLDTEFTKFFKAEEKKQTKHCILQLHARAPGCYDCVLLRSPGTWLKAKKNWDFFFPLDKITCSAPDWKYLGDMYLFPAFAAHLLESMFL